MQMSYVSIEERVPNLPTRDDAYLKTVELCQLLQEMNLSVAVHFVEEMRGKVKAPDQKLIDIFAKTQIALAQLHKFLKIENEINPRINQMLHH
tara:strand:+ start:409 stop:687 length:279 start_codon:yes stop_codon:yes gene_type:complete